MFCPITLFQLSWLSSLALVGRTTRAFSAFGDTGACWNSPSNATALCGNAGRTIPGIWEPSQVFFCFLVPCVSPAFHVALPTVRAGNGCGVSFLVLGLFFPSYSLPCTPIWKTSNIYMEICIIALIGIELTWIGELSTTGSIHVLNRVSQMNLSS